MFFRRDYVDYHTNDGSCACDAHPEQDGGPGHERSSTFACYRKVRFHFLHSMQQQRGTKQLANSNSDEHTSRQACVIPSRQLPKGLEGLLSCSLLTNITKHVSCFKADSTSQSALATKLKCYNLHYI